MKAPWKLLSILTAFLLILALAGTASANSWDDFDTATITSWSGITSALTCAQSFGDWLQNNTIHNVNIVYPGGMPNATQLGYLQPLLFSTFDPTAPTTFNITGVTPDTIKDALDAFGLTLKVEENDFVDSTTYTLTITETPGTDIFVGANINYTATIYDATTGGDVSLTKNDLLSGYFNDVANWPAPHNADLASETPDRVGDAWVITILKTTPNPTVTTNPTFSLTPNPTPRPSYTYTPTATPTPAPTPTPGEGGGPDDRDSSYDKGYWMYPSVFGSTTTASTPPPSDFTVGSGSGTVTAPQPLSAPRFLLLGKGFYASKTSEITKIYSSTYARASLLTVHQDAPLIIWGGRIYNTSNETNWRRVLLSDQRLGYVRETSFQPYSEEKPSVLLAYIYGDARFFEITKSSNIFDKIGTGRTAIGVASRGTVVAIYDESGTYSHVQCGKVKGWVRTSALRAIDVSTYKLN